ncbi:rna-directed dna polymerase from mobile element jockey-like [Pitangus sulphuratus]|nr:rna-directed dna polymerase from mobile element jockey-like [Pitangus sulphuratus]
MWRPVTFLREYQSKLILGLALFKIFVGDMNSGIERILSKIADNTKLHDVVKVLKGSDTTQMDLEKPEEWDHVKLRKFKANFNFKILRLSRGNPKHKQRQGREWIESNPGGKDLEGVDGQEAQHWPRKVVDALSPDVFKARLDGALSGLVY